MSHITARGVMNFTHDAKFHGPASAGCLVNYRFYDEGQPLQEVTLECALSYSSPIRSCLRYLDGSRGTFNSGYNYTPGAPVMWDSKEM